MAWPLAVKGWAIEVPVPDKAPVTLVTVGVHANVVPLTLFGLVIAMEVVPVRQNVWEVGLTEALGTRFTVTTVLIGVPEHPFAVGVIEYVAVPLLVPVVVNGCEIGVPLPDDANVVTLTSVTVQPNVAPATLLERVIGVAIPEQTDGLAGDVVTLGNGFTVTTTCIGLPWQAPFEGIILYVTVPFVVVELKSVWAMVISERPLPPVPPEVPGVCETDHV